MLTFGSPGAVVAGACAGLGVTMVSREAVAAQLAEGLLVELPVDGTPLRRPWHAVTQVECTPSTELLVQQLIWAAGWTPVSTPAG